MVSVTDRLSSNGQWNNLVYSSSDYITINPTNNGPSYNSSGHKGKVNGKLDSDASLPLFEAIKNQRYRQALLLIQSGQDVNSRNDSNETPLIYLSRVLNRKEHKKMRIKFTKLFLDFGGNPNLQDYRGQTVLMVASIRGHDELVQSILCHDNTDITIQDKEGNTALMLAARSGQLGIIECFIQHFIKRELDPNLLRQRNNQGKNALELAKEEGKTEVVSMLTNYLTQFNNIYAKDLERWASVRPTVPKAKSLDSISIDSDGTYTASGPNDSSNGQTKRPLVRRRQVTGADLRDSQSDGANFESALRRKIESLKSSRSFGGGLNGGNDKPDYYEEIWEQETMSWFSGGDGKESSPSIEIGKLAYNEKNGKRDYKESNSPLKLPPIGSNRLIDYKTWCELGGHLITRQKRNNSESMAS